MKFQKLDLNLLVALDVLLKERSVSRAAQILHLSPSALSNSLARLREYFGDELLVQIGRKLELTPRAEALQPAIHELLLRIDSAIGIDPAFKPNESDRTFRILMSDYAQMVLAPKVLAAASKSQATVRIDFIPQVEVPHRSLERGEADLLVIPSGFMSPDHPREALYKENFVCMLWRESRLAKAEWTFDRYVAAEHVVMQPPGGAAEAFESWFLKRYGVTRRIAASSYSFVTLAPLVVGTEYVSTVHERLADLLAKAWPLEIRPTPMPFDSMEESMQWHKYRTNDPGLAWLRGIFKEAGQQLHEAENAAPAS